MAASVHGFTGSPSSLSLRPSPVYLTVGLVTAIDSLVRVSRRVISHHFVSIPIGKEDHTFSILEIRVATARCIHRMRFWIAWLLRNWLPIVSSSSRSFHLLRSSSRTTLWRETRRLDHSILRWSLTMLTLSNMPSAKKWIHWFLIFIQKNPPKRIPCIKRKRNLFLLIDIRKIETEAKCFPRHDFKHF